MPHAPTSSAEPKKGDKLTTVHGEKLVVIDVETTPDVVKKGELLKKGTTYILAMSGGHLTKFPISKIAS